MNSLWQATYGRVYEYPNEQSSLMSEILTTQAPPNRDLYITGQNTIFQSSLDQNAEPISLRNPTLGSGFTRPCETTRAGTNEYALLSNNFYSTSQSHTHSDILMKDSSKLKLILCSLNLKI